MMQISNISKCVLLPGFLLMFSISAWSQEAESHSYHHMHPETGSVPKEQASEHDEHSRRADADINEVRDTDEQTGHALHDHRSMDEKQPRTPIPVLTDADREAAFPPDLSHPVHDEQVHYFVLFDKLEMTDSDDGRGSAWELVGWVGKDVERLWIRSEGERLEGVTGFSSLEMLYGRSISTWWDVVGGLRHDFGAGPSQSFVAFGIQGLSPYLFEFESTVYLGEGGQVGARIEAEYDTLVTNRLILQWRAELDLYGKNDTARGIGAGLNSVEAGARLRYEVRREFAPYLGIEWERSYGETANLRRLAGEDEQETRLVAGVRIWF